MQALILCGGAARRMGAALGGAPKCLAMFCGRPLLWYALAGARQAGASEALLFAGSDTRVADQLTAFAESTDLGLPVRVVARESRSTAEAVRATGDLLREPFLCTHGNLVADSGLVGRFADTVRHHEEAFVTLGSRLDRATTHPILRRGLDDCLREILTGPTLPDDDCLRSLEYYYCPWGTLARLRGTPHIENMMFGEVIGRLVVDGVHGMIVEHRKDWYHLATPEDLGRQVPGLALSWGEHRGDS